MKIADAFRSVLLSVNVVDRKPIYETYDKNVQGNTVHERGDVAAAVVAPFRNFPELSEKSSKTAVALSPGGNPHLARIDAKQAAISAVCEGLVATAAVGGMPLCVTDCLNFGNPEKKDQMGEFVSAIDGLKEVCEGFDVPIVSGNVSLYNESGGRSIPPSALTTVFARVDDPTAVVPLHFQKEDDTIFVIGARSENLGGSEFLRVHNQTDTRIPQVDVEALHAWLPLLRKAVQEGMLSSVFPIGKGGLLTTVAKASFRNKIGADLEISEEGIPQFLFSEDLGVIVSTNQPQKIQALFGDHAQNIGCTRGLFNISIEAGEEDILNQDLSELKKEWEKGLRSIF